MRRNVESLVDEEELREMYTIDREEGVWRSSEG